MTVGNKVDLSHKERVVHRAAGQTLADQWMCPFYETSAKNSINVNQVNFLKRILFRCLLT